MNTKIISEKALTLIDQYSHFKIGDAVISIPYYNNNHKKIRAALRATTGKGSPKDIFDETEILLVKNGIRNNTATSAIQRGAVEGGAFVPGTITDESLTHFLVDQDIGIDCSGFAYYVLNAESVSRKKGALDRHLKFPYCKGIVGKMRCKIRPIENADVRTFANNKNSHPISLSEITPGDIITMLGDTNQKSAKSDAYTTASVRDHILVITQVEYQNFIPTTIHYTHSIAWPTDGEYSHGVRTGEITILNINKPLTDQLWTEAEKTGTRTTSAETASAINENYTLERALKSTTEVRRLNWF